MCACVCVGGYWRTLVMISRRVTLTTWSLMWTLTAAAGSTIMVGLYQARINLIIDFLLWRFLRVKMPITRKGAPFSTFNLWRKAFSHLQLPWGLTGTVRGTHITNQVNGIGRCWCLTCIAEFCYRYMISNGSGLFLFLICANWKVTGAW